MRKVLVVASTEFANAVRTKAFLIGILMLQYMPSDTYPVVTDYRNLVYQALVD